MPERPRKAGINLPPPADGGSDYMRYDHTSLLAPGEANTSRLINKREGVPHHSMRVVVHLAAAARPAELSIVGLISFPVKVQWSQLRRDIE